MLRQQNRHLPITAFTQEAELMTSLVFAPLITENQNHVRENLTPPTGHSCLLCGTASVGTVFHGAEQWLGLGGMCVLTIMGKGCFELLWCWWVTWALKSMAMAQWLEVVCCCDEHCHPKKPWRKSDAVMAVGDLSTLRSIVVSSLLLWPMLRHSEKLGIYKSLEPNVSSNPPLFSLLLSVPF